MSSPVAKSVKRLTSRSTSRHSSATSSSRKRVLAGKSTSLAAFRAGALPAGESLVAGFRSVDFPAKSRVRDDDVADEWREVERDVSLFTLLAIGLLMRKALVLKDH